jgi:hypothetical protein
MRAPDLDGFDGRGYPLSMANEAHRVGPRVLFRDTAEGVHRVEDAFTNW